MSLILAIRAFFAILFGLAISDEVADRILLQSGRKKEELGPGRPSAVDLDAVRAAAKEEAKKEFEAELAQRTTAPAGPKGPAPEAVAVRALSVFQSEGRLFDFLQEEIDGYQDAEIGAAVREIHRGCRRALKDHFKLTPVRTEAEESMVTVPEGYDPAEIRLVGNVVGRPPFSGTLKHKGWRVEEVRLPNIPEGNGAKVIAPAEVEV